MSVRGSCDAAQYKFVDLREHTAIAVEESETESRDFALRCILLTATDVTVKSCGQRAVKGNPLVGQRQIEGFGLCVARNWHLCGRGRTHPPIDSPAGGQAHRARGGVPEGFARLKARTSQPYAAASTGAQGSAR
jgi:hypothetical protein